MTETPQAASESAAGTAGFQRPSRLGQAAAVVGIIAGVIFIVGAVFFSGFFLGSRWEHQNGPQGEEGRNGRHGTRWYGADGAQSIPVDIDYFPGPGSAAAVVG
jgi:hypothetical protein